MKATKAKKRELQLGPLWQERNQEFYRRLHELARSTEPADREVMEAKVRRLYKALGKEEPHISWCDSPLQLYVIPYLIDRFGAAGDFRCSHGCTQNRNQFNCRRIVLEFNLNLPIVKMLGKCC